METGPDRNVSRTGDTLVVKADLDNWAEQEEESEARTRIIHWRPVRNKNRNRSVVKIKPGSRMGRRSPSEQAKVRARRELGGRSKQIQGQAKSVTGNPRRQQTQEHRIQEDDDIPATCGQDCYAYKGHWAPELITFCMRHGTRRAPAHTHSQITSALIFAQISMAMLDIGKYARSSL